MGFGSYDESEQQSQDVNTDEEGVETVHQNDHDGELTFDSESSTTELLDQLEEIKADADEE